MTRSILAGSSKKAVYMPARCIGYSGRYSHSFVGLPPRMPCGLVLGIAFDSVLVSVDAILPKKPVPSLLGVPVPSAIDGHVTTNREVADSAVLYRNNPALNPPRAEA